ncbi:MAG: RNA polymerase sigma factor [Bacteroidales bacterium]|nr:RNA polymerase sigma factor [Bacteroidales bacterium]
MTDDRHIIKLCHEGEYELAFNSIVDTYSERLYWHVRRFLCSHEDTNDLLQDIFIKIWSSLSSFRGDAQIYTWLYRIATNETLNHLKKIRRENAISLDAEGQLLASRIDEDPYFNGDALQRELHKAIQQLPEKQRLVFNMRYFDELKYEDIAEITGTSVGALKASYHHAYNKIKEALENADI